MPGECHFCGKRRVKREAAHGSKYVGACSDCRREWDGPPRHVETCDRDACPVCDDYRREFGAP